jgi:hypothetical protein
MTTCQNNKCNKRLILCLDTPLDDVRKAAEALGWGLHPVNSIQDAIQAMQNRPYDYEAMVVGLGDTYIHPHGVAVLDRQWSFEIIKSLPCTRPLISYAATHFPSIFRIVYTAFSNVKDSCIASGADAVVSTSTKLARTLRSLQALESIVPVGTSSYFPLQRRQEREDQLIRIAQGRTTERVKKLAYYTVKFQKQLQSIPRQYIHTVREFNGNCNKSFVRMVHVSDTNTHHRYLHLPRGDLFVHTGNFTNPQLPKADAIRMFADFLDWLHYSVVPNFAMVVFIAGNHDDILDSLNRQFLGEYYRAKQMLSDFLRTHPSAKYLKDTSTIFRGLTIYGSPTVFCRQVSRDHTRYIAFEHRVKSFKKAPLDDVDILLTNRAPSILDPQSDYVLPVDHIYQMRSDRKRQVPKIHAFGHCNKNFGIGDYRGTLMMNGSQELLHLLDKYGGGTPLVIDIPLPGSESPDRKCGPRFFKSSVDGDHGLIEV